MPPGYHWRLASLAVTSSPSAGMPGASPPPKVSTQYRMRCRIAVRSKLASDFTSSARTNLPGGDQVCTEANCCSAADFSLASTLKPTMLTVMPDDANAFRRAVGMSCPLGLYCLSLAKQLSWPSVSTTSVLKPDAPSRSCLAIIIARTMGDSFQGSRVG